MSCAPLLARALRRARRRCGRPSAAPEADWPRREHHHHLPAERRGGRVSRASHVESRSAAAVTSVRCRPPRASGGASLSLSMAVGSLTNASGSSRLAACHPARTVRSRVADSDAQHHQGSDFTAAGRVITSSVEAGGDRATRTTSSIAPRQDGIAPRNGKADLPETRATCLQRLRRGSRGHQDAASRTAEGGRARPARYARGCAGGVAARFAQQRPLGASQARRLAGKTPGCSEATPPPAAAHP